jgi:hypothetical protein
MSAVKDTQQNITFVYSNFYQIYRKSQLSKGIVLKAHSVTETPAIAEVRVVTSQQSEELKQWSHAADDGKRHMAENLRALRDARKRLSFLMNEMDELLKRS